LRMGKIIAAIFTAIVAPVIVWWLTIGQRQTTGGEPNPPTFTPGNVAITIQPMIPTPTTLPTTIRTQVPQQPANSAIVFPGGPWISLSATPMSRCQEVFQIRTGISSSNTRIDLFEGDFAIGVRSINSAGTSSASLSAYIGSRGTDPAVVTTPGNGQPVNTTQNYRFGNRALNLSFAYAGPSAFGGAYDLAADRMPC